MIGKGKISSRQCILLLTLFIVSTELLFLPGLIVDRAKEGAWLSIVIGALFGASIVFIVAALAHKYPNKSIVEYPNNILGSTWGKIIGFALVSYAFISSSIILREFFELLETSFMPETPPSVFAVTFILVAALGVRTGIEVIARNSELFFALAYIITVFLLVLLIKDVELKKLLPVFGDGLVPIIHASVPTAGFMGEILLLAFLIPNLNNPRDAVRVGLWSLLLITATLVVVTEFSLGVFGTNLTASSLFPALSLGRFISVADFLEHLDAFFLTYWVISVFIKLSLFYYVAVVGTAQLTGLKEYKSLILPAAVIINNLSFVFFSDTIELMDWLGEIWGPYAITIEFIIPLSLLAIVFTKNRRDQPTNEV